MTSEILELYKKETENENPLTELSNKFSWGNNYHLNINIDFAYNTII